MARMVSATARQIAPSALEHTDREAWLALRRGGVGGSDVASILGLPGSFGSAWQVWVDKTQAFGDLPSDRSEKEEERMRWGHRAEAGAAEEFKLRHPGVRLSRLGMLQHVDEPWMRVNLDWRIHGCDVDPDRPCLGEVKNRIQFASKDWDETGDADRVPDAPAAQTQWGLMITGYGHGHLLVVIGGGEMREYVIKADPELQGILLEETRWFWEKYVLTGEAPPVDASERTGQILARLWDADPDNIITATPALIELAAELADAKEAAKGPAEEVDRLAHELQAMLGPAEVAVDPVTGQPVVTWKQNGTLNASRLREEQPGLFAACSVLTSRPDTKALAEAAPDVYRKYRARVLRTPTLKK
jgi:putative phage-type endonuclease